MKIIVLGFYDRGNLGDESYKLAMRQLLPQHDLIFHCIDDADVIKQNDYQVVIVGGGDVINAYFYTKLRPFLNTSKGLKLTVTVGFPFPSLIHRDYYHYYDPVLP